MCTGIRKLLKQKLWFFCLKFLNEHVKFQMIKKYESKKNLYWEKMKSYYLHSGFTMLFDHLMIKKGRLYCHEFFNGFLSLHLFTHPVNSWYFCQFLNNYDSSKSSSVYLSPHFIHLQLPFLSDLFSSIRTCFNVDLLL